MSSVTMDDVRHGDTARKGDSQDEAERIDLVRRACQLIEAGEGAPVTLADLSQELRVSPWHLQRIFKRTTGVSPREYADAQRARRFRDELKAGEGVASATYGAGYGSSSRVYENAHRQLGMTPASYARGGKGAVVGYSIVDSPLGRLMVAATSRGVCFVALGEDDESLKTTLEAEFPRADALERQDEAIRPAVEELLAYIAGETPHIDLPIDVRATAFQRKVWQELVAIPVGETRSYSEIAERLGLPRGQRAVGRACASNPVSLPRQVSALAYGIARGCGWRLDISSVPGTVSIRVSSASSHHSRGPRNTTRRRCRLCRKSSSSASNQRLIAFAGMRIFC